MLKICPSAGNLPVQILVVAGNGEAVGSSEGYKAKAGNGETILSSPSYSSEDGAKDGAQAVKRAENGADTVEVE